MAERGRPRQPLTVTDEEREVLGRWSRRPTAPHSIAQRARIGRIWHAFGLKPWLTDTFKLSEDPQFVDKVRGETFPSIRP